jgi:hypothetical protein
MTLVRRIDDMQEQALEVGQRNAEAIELVRKRCPNARVEHHPMTDCYMPSRGEEGLICRQFLQSCWPLSSPGHLQDRPLRLDGAELEGARPRSSPQNDRNLVALIPVIVGAEPAGRARDAIGSG